MPLRVLHLDAKYGAVADHIEALTRLMPDWAVSDELRVGLAEALSNAIVHGALRVRPRKGDDDLERFLDDLIAAEAERAGATITVGIVSTLRRMILAIADGGPGFDWRLAARGQERGLGILGAAFGPVRWNAAGNVLLIALDAPEQAA